MKFTQIHALSDCTQADAQGCNQGSLPHPVECAAPQLKNHLSTCQAGKSPYQNWLVGIPTLLKYMKVSWHSYSQYMEN